MRIFLIAIFTIISIKSYGDTGNISFLRVFLLNAIIIVSVFGGIIPLTLTSLIYIYRKNVNLLPAFEIGAINLIVSLIGWGLGYLILITFGLSLVKLIVICATVIACVSAASGFFIKKFKEAEHISLQFNLITSFVVEIVRVALVPIALSFFNLGK